MNGSRAHAREQLNYELDNDKMNNDDYTPIREVWSFEQYLASKPEVWRIEALNLRYSAEVLWMYGDEVMHRIFHEKTAPRLPGFFEARVARMLMGFSLENLIKAILLQEPEKFRAVFSKEGNLSWGKDGHNLLKLINEANIETSRLERTYLESWQLCSLWAGRYPLPTKEVHFPRQRKPLPSQEALFKRRERIYNKALEEGDQLLGADVYDIIHGGVGVIERETFVNLFNRCDSHLTGKEVDQSH